MHVKMNRELVLILYFGCIIRVSSVSLDPKGTVNIIRYENQTFKCTVDAEWNSVLIYFDSVNSLFLSSKHDNCNNLANPPMGLYTTTCDYVGHVFSITINNVTDEYNDKTAKCAVGKKTDQTVITVQYPPDLPLPITQSPKGYVKESTSVTLTCEIIGGNPLANIEWKCSGFTVVQSTDSFDDRTQSSVQRFVTKDDDTIECVCFGKHPLWKTPKNVSREVEVTYRPIVTVLPEYSPYNELENKTDVKFACIVTDTNPAITSFSWRKDNKVINTASNYTISKVERSDTGKYTCDATNPIGTSSPSPMLQFYVLYGIDIIPNSKEEQREGELLSIYCNGQSYPPVEDNDVTWTKQNNNSFNSKIGRYLIIGNANRLDTGIFVCSIKKTLSPSVGQSVVVNGSSTVEVDILYRPTVTVSPEYNIYNVTENTTNIQLTCKVVDGNPMFASYWWLRNSSFISNSAIFDIARVKWSDTGMYRCQANNSVGLSELSTAINLKVMYVQLDKLDEIKLNEGTRLFVSCNGHSYPEFSENHVIWTKNNNNTFNRPRRDLVIDNVNRNDSGTYKCSVTLKVKPTIGESVDIIGTTTVHVNILYRPAVILSPVYGTYKVIENSTNLQLNCTVTDANPPEVLSYEWYKDASQIFASSSYIIPTVQRTHSGNYTCAARNTVGPSESSQVLQLNVLYGVTIDQISLKRPHEGQQLTVECRISSNPNVTESDITWTKQDNNTFSKHSGRKLTIKNVSRLDSGTFLCSVTLKLTPSIGQSVTVAGTTELNVDVLYRPTVVLVPVHNPYDVPENSSNVQLTCNVTSTNPNVTSFKWFKDGSKLLITDRTFTMAKVNRTNSGYYTCDATNSVGTSMNATVLELNVLYGVSLELSATEITVAESHKWNISCHADSNPLPLMTLVYKYNNSALVEKKSNTTSILVDQANCVDTGLYMCSGNNSIGDSVTHSAYVRVACKPRAYTNVERHDIFLNGTDESLRIEAKFISYPLCDVSWYRKLPEGNLTTLDKEFNISNIKSDLPYETINVLQKGEIKSSEFGSYIANASNIHGSFLLTYHVSAKRAPDPPTNVIAICHVTSIKVSWKSKFNGGVNQTFRIHFVDSQTNISIHEDGINDMGENNFEKKTLNPDTWYDIFIEAYNVYGTTKSTETTNCTTDQRNEENQPVSSALVGGIAGSISAMLIVVVIIGGLYFWRRRQINGGDKELINRGQKETDEDEEGLQENPLYITSGESSNADIGPVYGVVNKQKQNKKNIAAEEIIDTGPVYSLVQKSKTQGKKKGKEKKEKKIANTENHTDIELGTVYENSDKLGKQESSDELYANAGEQMKGADLAKVYTAKKNKDGLIYADLDLIPGPSGKKFVIRGLENKTNYAIIDLSIKVDPLPSDDEDDDKDNTGTKSTLDKNNS